MRARRAAVALAPENYAAWTLVMLLTILVLLLPRPAAAASPRPSVQGQAAASYADLADADTAEAPAPSAGFSEPFTEAASDPAADLEAELGRAAPGASLHVEALGWGLLVQGEVPSAEAEARVREIAAANAGPVRLDLSVRPPNLGLRVRLVEAPATALPQDLADASGAMGALKLARVRAEEGETVRSGGLVRIHLDAPGGVVAIRPVYVAQDRIRLEVARADARGAARSVEMTPWSTLLIRHAAAIGRPSRLGRVVGVLRRPWTLGRAAPSGKEVMLVVQPSLPGIDDGAAEASPVPDLIVADLAPETQAPSAAPAAPLRRWAALGRAHAASALRFLRRLPAPQVQAQAEPAPVLREAALTQAAR